jgi:putative tryptophan/tyrosine transport system substrate-binding protein
LTQSGHAERCFDHFQPSSLTRYDALLGALGLAMRRRDFVKGIGGSAIAWPLAARAQHPAMPVIGFLGGANPVGYAPQIEALRLGLREQGYVEGQNIAVEYRWAEGRYDRLPELAADLVRRKVAVIVTQGTPAAFAAKQATTTIPIVMAIVGNPVDTGLVSSLAEPGGNITGSSFFYAEISAKRLEIMKELMPSLAHAGVLLNLDNPAMPSIERAMMQTAKTINVTLQSMDVRHLNEMESAFERTRSQLDAIVVVEDGLFVANRARIAELAINMRLPSIGFREYCEAGGLAAYGVDFPQIWRGAGAFIDKILKGRKPADLPIEQATRFEIILNLKTAKTLSFDVSPAMSARANEVIE